MRRLVLIPVLALAWFVLIGQTYGPETYSRKESDSVSSRTFIQRNGALGIFVSAVPYSEIYVGGADSIRIEISSKIGAPSQVSMDYSVSAVGGEHPTTDLGWTSLVDTTGQSASSINIKTANVGKYTAYGDTIFVRYSVFLDGSLHLSATDTIQSTASYWYWWNYKFPFVITIDDGYEVSVNAIDSLLTAMEASDGVSRKFTSGINAVHTLALADTVNPLGWNRRSTPTQLRGHYANGNLEIANHGYTAASLWSSTARGSANSGGLVSASDTVSAAAAGYWPGDFRALWSGDYVTGSMHSYYNEATDVVLSGYGILRDSSDSSLVWSPLTVEEHVLVEMERDSLTAFGIVTALSQVKTFIFPGYAHCSDLLTKLETEGYIGARGAPTGQTASYNDLGEPLNTWAGISVYRVPVMHDLFSWLTHSETEGEFKTAIASDISDAGVATDHGIMTLTTLHTTHATQDQANYLEPQEIQWAIEQAEADGGITVSLGEAVAYYRSISSYNDIVDLDIIYHTPDVTAPTVSGFAVQAPDSSAGNLVFYMSGTCSDDTFAAEYSYKINYDGSWSSAVGATFFDTELLWSVTTTVDITTVVDLDSLYVRMTVADVPEGNTSDYYTSTQDIDRAVPADTTAPVVTVANASQDTTSQAGDEITLYFDSSADETGYHRAGYSRDGGARTLFAWTDTTVTADSTVSFTLELDDTPDTSTSYKVFAWAKDAADNVSDPDSASITITRAAAAAPVFQWFYDVVFDSTSVADTVSVTVQAKLDITGKGWYQWRGAAADAWNYWNEVYEDDSDDQPSKLINTHLATSALDSFYARGRFVGASGDTSAWSAALDTVFTRKAVGGAPNLYVFSNSSTAYTLENAVPGDSDTLTYNNGGSTWIGTIIEVTSGYMTDGQLQVDNPTVAVTSGLFLLDIYDGLPMTNAGASGALMHFPVKSSISINDSVLSSVLYIYTGANGFYQTGTFSAYACSLSSIVAWVDESDASYDYSDVSLTTAWGTAWSTYTVTSDFAAARDDTTPSVAIPSSSWFWMTVTTGVSAWCENDYPNGGFFLYGVEGTPGAYDDFRIYSSSTATAANRPYLLVWITEGD